MTHKNQHLKFEKFISFFSIKTISIPAFLNAPTNLPFVNVPDFAYSIFKSMKFQDNFILEGPWTKSRFSTHHCWLLRRRRRWLRLKPNRKMTKLHRSLPWPQARQTPLHHCTRGNPRQKCAMLATSNDPWSTAFLITREVVASWITWEKIHFSTIPYPIFIAATFPDCPYYFKILEIVSKL